jgi:hypothetical protein
MVRVRGNARISGRVGAHTTVLARCAPTFVHIDIAVATQGHRTKARVVEYFKLQVTDAIDKTIHTAASILVDQNVTDIV